MRMSKTTITMLLGLILLYPLDAANAYVDPGTGSYVLQIAIAGLFGVLFSIKLFWQNIKAFLLSTFSKASDEEQTIEQEK